MRKARHITLNTARKYCRNDGRFLTAAEVSELLKVSESTAYRVIQKLNDELEARGFLTFKARVISRYFYERYGMEG